MNIKIENIINFNIFSRYTCAKNYSASVKTGINFVGLRNDDTNFPSGPIKVDSLLEIIRN